MDFNCVLKYLHEVFLLPNSLDWYEFKTLTKLYLHMLLSFNKKKTPKNFSVWHIQYVTQPSVICNKRFQCKWNTALDLALQIEGRTQSLKIAPS